jgi:hypothetical protein
MFQDDMCTVKLVMKIFVNISGVSLNTITLTEQKNLMTL